MLNIKSKEDALLWCISDEEYYKKLKEIVSNAPISIDDAIDYLNRPLMDYKIVMKLACLGYSNDYIKQEYTYLLVKHREDLKSPYK